MHTQFTHAHSMDSSRRAYACVLTEQHTDFKNTQTSHTHAAGAHMIRAETHELRARTRTHMDTPRLHTLLHVYTTRHAFSHAHTAYTARRTPHKLALSRTCTPMHPRTHSHLPRQLDAGPEPIYLAGGARSLSRGGGEMRSQVHTYFPVPYRMWCMRAQTYACTHTPRMHTHARSLHLRTHARTRARLHTSRDSLVTNQSQFTEQSAPSHYRAAAAKCAQVHVQTNASTILDTSSLRKCGAYTHML